MRTGQEEAGIQHGQGPKICALPTAFYRGFLPPILPPRRRASAPCSPSVPGKPLLLNRPWNPCPQAPRPPSQFKSSHQFRNPGNSHINMRYFIPCGKIHHSCLGQSEDGLEFPHRFRGPGAVYPVRRHPGNGRINSCYFIQLFLHLSHLIPGASYGQVTARPGGRYPGYLLRRVHVDAVPVKITQYLYGTIALLSKGA